MQTVLSNTTKIVVDSKSGGNMLFLPLEKIMQMSGAAAAGAVEQGAARAPAAAEPVPQAPAAAAAAPESQARSREAFRTREREGRP